MEAKDLILLMMIPVLIASIIAYTDNGAITGAVTAKTEESNIIGAYSIMPNFKAKADYDLKDYADLRTKLKTAIDECKRGDMWDCLKSKSKSLGWECAENDELKILNDFIDKLNDCINLEEDNVVCRFSLDDNTLEVPDGIYEIELTGGYQNTKVKLKKNEEVLDEESVGIKSLSYASYDREKVFDEGVDSVNILLKVKDKKTVVEKAVGIKDRASTELSKIFLLYKTKDDVMFVDSAVESSFRAPLVNKIVDLPKTRGIKFCKNSGKRVYAYDTSDNSVKLRDIVYKFAVTFPEPPPKPVAGIQVLDAVNAENADVLTWDKSDERSIKSYSIYYSGKDFMKEKTEEIKKNADVKKSTIPAENPIEIESIDLNVCEFEPIGKQCKYAGYGKPLEKNELYYLKPKDSEKGKFIYLLTDIKDEIEYNFAVTAANSEREEIDNDYSVKDNTYIFTLNNNYGKFTSKDDLAPGKVENLHMDKTDDGKIKLIWNKPVKNLDGSQSTGIKYFNFHYNEASAIPPSLEAPKKQITAQEAKCENEDMDCEYVFEEIERGKPFNVAFVAVDEDGNKYDKAADAISVILP